MNRIRRRQQARVARRGSGCGKNRGDVRARKLGFDGASDQRRRAGAGRDQYRSAGIGGSIQHAGQSSKQLSVVELPVDIRAAHEQQAPGRRKLRKARLIRRVGNCRCCPGQRERHPKQVWMIGDRILGRCNDQVEMTGGDSRKTDVDRAGSVVRSLSQCSDEWNAAMAGRDADVRRRPRKDEVARLARQARKRPAKKTGAEAAKTIIIQLLDFEGKTDRLAQGEDLIVVTGSRAEQGPYAKRFAQPFLRQRNRPLAPKAIAPHRQRVRQCRRLETQPEALQSPPHCGV